MKIFLRILSYVTTALAACAVTLFLCARSLSGGAKLDQVRYLIENCFIEKLICPLWMTPGQQPW